jgi:endonuclease YncB( thermonuclease family)
MIPKQKDVLVLALLIIALVIINYSWLDNALNNFLNTYEQVHVDRIIDGDTIESNSTSIRLLGINTPERGELYYEEAKEFLEQEILNKTVNLKYGKERYDKYQRVLAYIFFDNQNINLKLIENGLANTYFPSGKDQYYDQFIEAWEDCINSQVNLCEPSQHVCAQCISINKNNIINNCNFQCNISNWRIKAEGRKKFIFSDIILGSEEETSFELELTETGDTLFLRDDEGGLVLWESY